jgi:hypothetical protein
MIQLARQGPKSTLFPAHFFQKLKWVPLSAKLRLKTHNVSSNKNKKEPLYRELTLNDKNVGDVGL